MPETPPSDGARAPDGAPELRCDFCGTLVPRVRRIALDRDYDRLQTPHSARYACPECSQRKELERLGLATGSRR
jgi:ribosomal protein L37AE/L43A